jgi:hypothetical protein
MTQQDKEIEVEVVEIDGVTPASGRKIRAADAVDAETGNDEWRDWRHWQGRVRRLDSRWWPLWLILGVLALGLLATVGVIIGLVAVVVALCMRLFRALFR